MVTKRNVLGGELVSCSDRASSSPQRGVVCDSEHDPRTTVCVTVTQEFLRHQRSLGNDLTARNEVSRFPGLRPGDSWCVPVDRWRTSVEAGAAAPVWLEGTDAGVLDVVTLANLREHAVDVPQDPGPLEG